MLTNVCVQNGLNYCLTCLRTVVFTATTAALLKLNK